MAATRPRVAIVGAGPAGAFAAASLLRARGDVEIDLFERLPTPWGLLRAGVAPDHQEIKRLQDTFERQTLARGCRFIGNVEVGTDVTHAELAEHYTAVVYATGAQTDKTLGIPGEDLPGSWAATEFVAWYNGHPDYRDLEFDLSGPRAVVIGNGNVAADVVRILTRDHDELARTDIADHALEALRASRIEEVVVLGRRGPAQAAFTSAELRELGRLDGVELRVDPAEVELDPVSAGVARRGGHLHGAQERRAAARVRRRGRLARTRRAPDRAALPALAGRAARRRARRGRRRRAATRSSAARTARCAPARPTMRSRRSRPASSCAPSATGRCRCPTCRSTSATSCCPTAQGRALTPEGEPLPGVYAVGWIKRGPTGILGTNKRDAEETIACLAEDLQAGALRQPPEDARERIDALLAERAPGAVTVDGWRAIDALEREQGRSAERPRVKLASRDELARRRGLSGIRPSASAGAGGCGRPRAPARPGGPSTRCCARRAPCGRGRTPLRCAPRRPSSRPSTRLRRAAARRACSWSLR